MLRSLLRVGAAIALAALVSPLTPSAAPGPGVAYDEIVRVVVGATPPPPGNFQADVAAINSSSTAGEPTPPPRKRLGFGAIAGAVLGGAVGGAGGVAGAVGGEVASNAMDNALQQSLGAQFASLGATIRGFLQPHLMRYAYYNGWERVDDVAAQTATIRKCDIGQVYQLNLAKKTYTIYDPNSEPTPAAVAAPAQRNSRPAPAGTPAPPGTAVATISSTNRALGPLRIDNVPTSGYNSTQSFAMTQATGSCRNASASFSTEEYLSAINRPSVTSCPVRRAPVPESPSEAVAPPQQTGGCRPTFAFNSSGPTMPAGKLSLYTLVTMSAAAGATPAPSASGSAGIGFLTERGNLKSVGASDASLFSVPSDFTKTP